MSIVKTASIISITGLLLTSGWYGLAYAGYNPYRVITEARCQSGAFLTPATSVHGTESEDDAATAHLNVGGKVSSAPVTGTNLIKNGDLEQVTGDTPNDWTRGSGGEQKSSFTLVPGNNSATAARVATANVKVGNADWSAAPVAVSGGTYYRFTDTYRSNVSSRAVLGITHKDGSVSYVNLDTTAAAANWTSYSTTFYTPLDATKITIAHELEVNGFLEVDNTSLQVAQAATLDRGLVSITFDDGWKGTHDNALPILKQFGMVSTQYLVSGYLGQAKDYMTPSDVYDLRDAGNEIGSHTVDHADLTKIDPKSAIVELKNSDKALTKCFGDVTSFAAPYGYYSSSTEAATSKVYTMARSTDTGYNTLDNLDTNRLKVQNISRDTTAAQLKDMIALAQQNHVWLILVYHDVSNNQGLYVRSNAQFTSDMQILKTSGITVKTMHDAYAEVQAQAVTK